MSALVQESTPAVDLVALGRSHPRLLRHITPGAPRPGWRYQAACEDLDPADFFPDARKQSPVEAVRACAGCPVAADCLTEALLNREQEGMWGGVDMRQVFGRGNSGPKRGRS